ncbi:MAG: DNA-3-methyladenine glycosylase [Armatimonadota bacterium]
MDRPVEPLRRSILLLPPPEIARALLGAHLRWSPDAATVCVLRIVETEAYAGDDPASHSFRGPTRANAAMFGPPGHAYVHINYGIHHCLNVVTGPEGRGEAVLIRAVEPADPDGTISGMRARWCGPGRLGRSLGVRKERHDGVPLLSPGGEFVLLSGAAVPEEAVARTPRIGISKAVDRPWRFVDQRSPLAGRR